jgi:hypothetical protein
MMIGTIRAGSIAVSSMALACVLSCAGVPSSAAAPAPAAAPAGGAAGAGAPGDAGVAVADAKVERPFAKTAVEAQALIQEQIDAHIKPLWKCVEQLRAAKGDQHKAVAVDIGIDQEGNLIGVTTPNAKGDLDPTMRDCMFAALHGLPFPRSHSGIITVRQSFKDELIQQ